MPRCHKKGCTQDGLVAVHLTDLDGDYHWNACLEHAELFDKFVSEESARQGANYSAVFTLITDDSAIIGVAGSDV